MIVCSCNVISDSTIKSAIAADAQGGVCPRTPSAVYKCLGCSPNCGRCFKTVRKLIEETMRAHAHTHGEAYTHTHPHAPGHHASSGCSVEAPVVAFAAGFAAAV